MGSGENFQLLEGIADKLGAAIGAPGRRWTPALCPTTCKWGRPARSSPRTCTSPSASPAPIQHLAGMKDSKVIAAINKDEDAPIFQVADYGLVADLFKALPELEALL